MSSTTAFYFHAPATTEIYTLSLHDALPISCKAGIGVAILPSKLADRERDLVRLLPTEQVLSVELWVVVHRDLIRTARVRADRKSTRLNSSHVKISYAVFCLKKKTKKNKKI